MSQLDLIKEAQKKQQELQILALEEIELKRQEEQQLINEELERQRIAMEERQKYLESEEENSEEDGEHRAFQLIHFGAGVEQKQKQASRQMDESRCLQGIARERAIKGSTCVANVDFTARVSCDVQETLNRNPDMSLCSACVRSGCCFDATPRIINGYLAPMCFHMKSASLSPSQIEEDLMQSLEEPEPQPIQPTLSEEEQYSEGD